MEGPTAIPLVPRPHAFLDYFPYLWSRVLFGGAAARQAAPAGKAWLLLVVLPAVLLYPGLSFHLFEPDEGRYAEIPREMLARSDWIVPHLLHEPYLDKPPLFYWLVTASYRLLGVHVWSARLIPALAVHGCVLVTYFLGRRSLGGAAAFWGALALALAPGFLSMGRLLILDGLLALCVTVALLSGLEAMREVQLRWRWWVLSALACALGILTKGPVAVVLTIVPLIAHRWLTGCPCAVSRRAWGGYAMLVLVVTLPWFVAIGVRQPSFASYFFWEHNVVRFMTPFDHLRPVWFYVPILVAGFLPASILAIPMIRFLLSGAAGDASRRGPELGFMLLAGGWCVLFFSLSGCKLPTYVLPAFPLLALAFGDFVAGSRWQKSRVLRGGVVAAVVVLALVNHAAMPWYARFHSPLNRPEEMRRLCSDPRVPVVCYPRNCDSVAFFLGRDDLRSYRSKQTPTLVEFLMQQPRTVVVFTHRHSLEGLRQVLPPQLQLTNEVPVSGSWRSFARAETCYVALVERR